MVTAGARRQVRLAPHGDGLTITLSDEGRALVLEDVDWRPGQPLFKARLDGTAFTVLTAPLAEGFLVRHRAARQRVLVLTPHSAELHDRLPDREPADTSRLVLSPMPGLVVSIAVSPGQLVKAGEALAVVEAMKMQNIIRSERDGEIKSVGPEAGDSIAADEVLVEFV